MKKSSDEHVLKLLTKLRALMAPHAKQSADHIATQNKAYTEALDDLEPQILSEAVDHVIKTCDRWPPPAAIRRAATEIQERRAAAAKLNTAVAPDDGATVRNEAIRLLGFFIAQLPVLTDEQLGQFTAEAARMWGKVRPPGGLEEADKDHKRAAYGFALEAWAREYLGLGPVHTAFLGERAAALHREMTGRDPKWHSDPAPMPVQGSMVKPVVREFGQMPWVDVMKRNAERVTQRYGPD